MIQINFIVKIWTKGDEEKQRERREKEGVDVGMRKEGKNLEKG